MILGFYDSMILLALAPGKNIITPKTYCLDYMHNGNDREVAAGAWRTNPCFTISILFQFDNLQL
jgi:hypothetical protein